MAGVDRRGAKGVSVVRRYGVTVVLCTTVAAVLTGQDAAPVFRVAADAVAVNVSVRRGSTPVPGLAPSDFRLYDNDVAQAVSAVSMDAVPVDMSIVLDLSTSVFWNIEAPRAAVQRIASFLRPTDRFRVITMGNSVVNAVPWQSAGPPDTSKIEYGLGKISLVADSVFASLLHRADSDRRDLVVALTDGEDICSLATGDTLRRAAERSGAVFHWVHLTLGGAPKKDLSARSQGVGSVCRDFSPGVSDLASSLSNAARLTGGSVHHATSERDVTAIAAFFNDILDDFRQSYILHYIPEGVTRTGWHRLRLELRERGLTIRTRPGYWA